MLPSLCGTERGNDVMPGSATPHAHRNGQYKSHQGLAGQVVTALYGVFRKVQQASDHREAIEKQVSLGD